VCHGVLRNRRSSSYLPEYRIVSSPALGFRLDRISILYAAPRQMGTSSIPGTTANAAAGHSAASRLGSDLDDERLAQAISDLLLDLTESRRLGGNPYQRVRDGFAWKHAYDNYLRL